MPCEPSQLLLVSDRAAAENDFLHNMIRKAVEGKDINHKGQGIGPPYSPVKLQQPQVVIVLLRATGFVIGAVVAVRIRPVCVWGGDHPPQDTSGCV